MPHRRNEPKIQFFDDDELDEEKTRVMPALRPNQYEAAVRPAVQEEDDEEETPPPKKKRWVKPFVWFVILMALVVGMWYAVQYVSKSIAPPSEVWLESFTGKTLAEAQTALEKKKLQPDVSYEASKDAAKDTVIRQDPSNMNVKVNSKVKLTVSAGPPKQKMPDVTKKKLSDALAALAQLGISQDRVDLDPQFFDADPDTVTSQTPVLNEDIDPATVRVKLTVSKGRETFKMPNLIGKTEAEARSILQKSNLQLAKDSVTTEANYKQSKGRVIMQFPFNPGDDVYPGAEITKLVISSGLPDDAGPMTVTVPVKPAKEGVPSNVEIYLSDATIDNTKYQTLSNVTKTENVDVKLVVAPDKNATITVNVDGQKADYRTVTYQDYLAQKNGLTNPAGNKSGTHRRERHKPRQERPERHKQAAARRRRPNRLPAARIPAPRRWAELPAAAVLEETAEAQAEGIRRTQEAEIHNANGIDRQGIERLLLCPSGRITRIRACPVPGAGHL
ncbi:PASTA domain-containing protein [Paenibacillus sp. P25]|nr:PASTA domain-containing protein [Paenibacillus sp. P25]